MGRKALGFGLAVAVGALTYGLLTQAPTAPTPPVDPVQASIQEAAEAAPAQESTQDRIRAGAEASAAALLDGDDARVVDLTYPRVVEQLGGRAAMLEIIATGRQYMAEQGLEMLSYTVDTVSDAYEAGSELHAVVRTQMKMKVPGGKMTQPGFLLAVSGDGGTSWRYIDGAQLNAETVLDVVPAFNSALELPTMLEPTLEEDP